MSENKYFRDIHIELLSFYCYIETRKKQLSSYKNVSLIKRYNKLNRRDENITGQGYYDLTRRDFRVRFK